MNTNSSRSLGFYTPTEADEFAADMAYLDSIGGALIERATPAQLAVVDDNWPEPPWSPFLPGFGTLRRDLAAEGWRTVGAIREDGRC